LRSASLEGKERQRTERLESREAGKRGGGEARGKRQRSRMKSEVKKNFSLPVEG